MTWQSLLDEKIQKFIVQHEKDDTTQLAMKKPLDSSWDYPLILSQIKARQKAIKKIPSWYKQVGVVFPPTFVVEQASSEATALYKSALFEGDSFVDLTGGAGIDTAYFSRRFQSGLCIERDQNSAELIAHNLSALDLKEISVRCGDSDVLLETIEPVELVYIDPQRRDENRKGKFLIEDCSPDILGLIPVLKQKARRVMVKASPMLDIWAACDALKYVYEVHIVQWKGDCKEVLYLLRFDQSLPVDEVEVISVEINDAGDVVNKFTYNRMEEREADISYSQPLAYLYEPGPAFQKSGGYKMLAKRFDLCKIHEHTQLYTSKKIEKKFPGKCFKIVGIYAVRAKSIPVKKANLVIRNSPQKIEGLRKKLKIKDGGDDTLFACTILGDEHTIIHCVKVY